MTDAVLPYEKAAFRDAAGAALRPGGTAATAAALGRCGWPRGARVVDVGCGRGATLALLTAMGWTALGFDSSPAMAAEAAANSGCRVEAADARALPLDDGEMDAAVCECLPGLFSDGGAVLREIGRVLAPGGGLLLSGVVVRGGGPYGGRNAAGAISAAGFDIIETVNLDRRLAALAAQLLWRGCGREELWEWLGLPDRAEARRGAGYRQWLARKRGARS